MYCFVAGVPPGLPDEEEQLELLIDTVKEYEDTLHPNKLLLIFDSMEAMTNAQWMLELNGSKPTKRKEETDEPLEGDE